MKFSNQVAWRDGRLTPLARLVVFMVMAPNIEAGAQPSQRREITVTVGTTGAPAAVPDGVLLVSWVSLPAGTSSGDPFPGAVPDAQLVQLRHLESVPIRGLPSFRFDLPDGERGYLVALYDRQETVLRSMLGEVLPRYVASSGVFVVARRAPVELRLEPNPPGAGVVASTVSGCPLVAGAQGGSFQLIDLPPVRVGEPPRSVCVRLPAGYVQGVERLRVAYVFGSRPLGLLRAAARPETARLERERGGVIWVALDTQTEIGASLMTDTPNRGAWETYVLRALVPEIDRRFRTVPTPDGRVVVGRGSGGHVAMRLALAHPAVFGAVAVSTAWALDAERWLFGGSAVRPEWLSWMRLEEHVGGPGLLSRYAAFLAPDLQSRCGFRWPVDVASGVIDSAAWASWQLNDPATILRTQAGAQAARRLAGRIFVRHGRRDEMMGFPGAEAFHGALSEMGVAHVWEAVDEGYHPTNEPEALLSLVRFVATLPHDRVGRRRDGQLVRPPPREVP